MSRLIFSSYESDLCININVNVEYANKIETILGIFLQIYC